MVHQSPLNPVPDRRPPVDIPAASNYLGVRPRYVRRLVNERRISFLKVGRLVRFDPEDLDDFLEECRVDAR
jgi:excisionase family DNA binding protein